MINYKYHMFPKSLMLNDTVKIMQCTCILNKNWSYKYICRLLIIKHKGVELSLH